MSQDGLSCEFSGSLIVTIDPSARTVGTEEQVVVDAKICFVAGGRIHCATPGAVMRPSCSIINAAGKGA